MFRSSGRRPPPRQRKQTGAAARRWVARWFAFGGVGTLVVVGLWLFGWVSGNHQSPMPVEVTSTGIVAPTVPVGQNLRPTPGATNPVPTASPGATLSLHDPALAQAMLAAINADRQANGLAPVAWDATAAAAGAAHAADMAAQNYFSHWSPDGHGPELRYNRAGGTDNAMENIFTWFSRSSDGQPGPVDSFTALVAEAEASLMRSPGHRRNILTPSHTHVGVGFAYNPQTGSFYLVQEFVDRYVAMEPLPLTGQLGAQITVAGRLLPGATAPLLNLTYAPFPQPLSLDELNATGSYQRDATIYASLQPQLNGAGSFSATIALDNERRPGVYSVRVWITVGGKQVPASEQLLEVR